MRKMKGKMSQEAKEKFYSEGHTLPKCVNEGCNADVSVREWKNWSFKTECSTCNSARKSGRMLDGITFHKKDYCENRDGQLGFICPVSEEAWKTSEFRSCLDLDHLDGNHYNNCKENTRTYCKLCHGRKSIQNGDCSSQKKSARGIESQVIRND